MADLGLIDSKLSLYIRVNVNNGQNKFEVHISKNVAKMAILWPKIGQRHFGARASHCHNLAIFHQILTNEHTKMTSSLRQIEWYKVLSSISLFYILVFLAPFLLRGLTWAMLYVWTKNYPQVVGTCSGHHGQLISQNCVLTITLLTNLELKIYSVDCSIFILNFDCVPQFTDTPGELKCY